MTDTQDRYKARYQREKKARREAEALLEQKSRDLYHSNQSLQALAESLETKVEERTHELQRARDEAIQYAKVKSDFLANMSHELRTPMNGVLGMLNLLEDANLDARESKLVKTAAHSGQLLLKIINDILDFTKLEENKLDLEHVPFDPIELIELVVEPFISQTIDKDIDLLTQIPPSIPSALISDPTRIQQIVTNLVSNAIKFTHEGYVLVQCFYEQGTMMLRIVDSGIGMSQQQCEKIFSAFSQADESTTRKYGGTGLGLSICKSLLEAMNGTIKVESEVNKGTTFTVEIPMESNGVARSYPSDDIEPNYQCILAIEHFLERSILEECLLHWKINVQHSLSDGSELNDLIKDSNIDLLVVEESLFNDIEELIELSRRYPKVQIFFYTKIENLNITEKQIICLNKPVKRSELFNALATISGCATIETGVKKSLDKYEFKQQSVLLVEDNLTNQEVAKELLKSVNLQVTIANNGQEAIDLLNENDFELVLMDIQMPVLDGLSATRKIRDMQGKYNDLPIFAMTAHNLKGDKEKSLSAGMNGHLTKPIVPKLLFAALSKHLDFETKTLSESNTVTKAKIEETKTNSCKDELDNCLELEDALERVGGNEKILYKLLGMFKQQQLEFIADFKLSCKQNDFETAIRLAHTLKGSAANSGAMNLSKFASLLEQHLKKLNETSTTNLDINSDVIAQLLVDIEKQLTQVFKRIDVLCEANTAPKSDSSDFDKETVLKYLQTIPEEVFSDISVVECAMSELSNKLSNTQYSNEIDKLNQYYNQFDYDNLISASKQLIMNIQGK